MPSTRAKLIAGLLLALCGAGAPAYAQSPLGPAQSEGAVTLERTGGFLQANFKGKNDQGTPVFQLGYTQRDDSKIARLRRQQRALHARNPNDDALNRPIQGVNLYGLELQATPSGNAGSLFTSDRLSVGSRITLSFGRSFLVSSLPSFSELHRLHLGNNLAQIEASIPTASAKILASHILDLETSFIPTLERSAAAAARGPQDDPFFRTQLARARELRVRAQLRLAVLQAAPAAPAAVSGQAASAAAAAAPGQAAPAAGAAASAQPAGQAGQAAGAPERRSGLLRALIYDALTVRASFSASRYTLYDPTAPFAEQFSTRDFQGPSVQLGYQANFGGRVPFIFGVNGGVGKENNAGELTEVEATDQRTITSPDGTTQRTTISKRKGLRGTYEEDWARTLRADLVFYPDLLSASRDGSNPRSTIAIDLFARATEGSTTIWGGGVYITQPGNPLKVYGGLNVYRDADRALAIDLVAGFPF